MPSRRKLAGFEEHARRSGISAAPVEHALFSLEGGQAADHPDAAPGRHRHHLRQRRAGARRDPGGAPGGPDRPGDVSVVGYDDSAG